jgi:hypothetical protein
MLVRGSTIESQTVTGSTFLSLPFEQYLSVQTHTPSLVLSLDQNIDDEGRVDLQRMGLSPCELTSLKGFLSVLSFTWFH